MDDNLIKKWRLDTKRDAYDINPDMRIVDKDGKYVCSTASAYYNVEDCKKHAKLIVMIPELLEALKIAEFYMESFTDSEEEFEYVDSVINRAEDLME